MASIHQSNSSEPDAKRRRVDAEIAAVQQTRSSLQTLHDESTRVEKTMQTVKREYKTEYRRLQRMMSDLKQSHSITLTELSGESSTKREQIIETSRDLRLRELCLALRQNDASIRRLDITVSNLPKGYVKPIGEALLDNETVASIDLCLSTLLPDLTVNEFASQAATNLDPILLHVRTSRSLRRVALCGKKCFDDNEETMVAAFLHAMMENPWIEDVALDCLLPSAFSRFLSTKSRTLKTLSIDADELNHSSLISWASVLEQMDALESLALSGLYVRDGFSVSCLEGLKTGCKSLKELKLSRSYVEPHFWDHLAEVVHSSKLLCHLKVGDMSFTESDMDGLIKSLKLPDNSGPSPTTISKLTFDDCRFYAGATKVLLNFLQTRVSRTDGEGSSLRELHGFAATGAIPDMLAATPNESETFGHSVSTVGAQLHTVTLQTLLHSDEAKFVALSKYIRLPCLRLRHLTNVSDYELLNRVLSALPCIRNVHVERITYEPHHGAAFLLNMLRRNATLCEVSMGTSQTPPVLNAAQLRHWRAYGQRNQFLIELVENRAWNHSKNQMDDQEYDQTEWNATRPDALLYPLLLPVAASLSVAKLYSVLSTLDCSAGCSEEPRLDM